ncbi:PD-(D/E)XK nuclease family protein [Gelidibacter sp.]|uniref:PD-(D/E)XK nuclease family protein n=1 Tax=Gelidibacter sp. TaxID=2018083 RepID=UPI003266B7BC
MQEFERLLEDIGSTLPDLPPLTPKNIFDILGVRNQENVNSKILAYFLDVNETHGLQSLFFDSLKTIIEDKGYANTEFLDNFNGDFNVLTEDTTAFAENEAKKRIDISILGDDKWGIII